MNRLALLALRVTTVCICMIGQSYAFEVPMFNVVSNSGVKSLVVGSMHGGFTLKGEISAIQVQAMNRYSKVFFESVPGNIDSSVRAAAALNSLVTDRELYDTETISLLVRNIEQGDGEVDKGLITLVGAVHPLIFNYILLGTCAQLTSGRSLDLEIKHRLSAGKVFGDIDSPKYTFEGVDGISTNEWRQHLITIARFSSRARCKHETSRYFDNISRSLVSGDVDDLWERHFLFYEKVIESTLVTSRIEFADRRHLGMVEVISSNAKEDGAVFIFGAAHLGGENGILKKLTQRGFKVSKWVAEKL